MESADLTPKPNPEDAALDALLQRPLAPLADAGFSQRVMAALPKKQRGFRPAFIALGALGGLAIAIARVESLGSFESDWTTVNFALTQTAAALGDPNSLIVLSVAGISVLYAFTSATLRRR